eukprot:1152826-Pelagomonas_calceolata.AAC.5
MRPPILAPAPGAASTQPSTYNPQALLAAVCRHAPQFKEKQQHDAHELLHCLLDGLQVGTSHSVWLASLPTSAADCGDDFCQPGALTHQMGRLKEPNMELMTEALGTFFTFLLQF